MGIDERSSSVDTMSHAMQIDEDVGALQAYSLRIRERLGRKEVLWCTCHLSPVRDNSSWFSIPGHCIENDVLYSRQFESALQSNGIDRGLLSVSNLVFCSLFFS